jgi:hypothetical protein
MANHPHCQAYTASSPGRGRYPQWTNLAAMGTSRAFHAATELGGKVYVCGGQGSQTGPIGSYGDPHAKARQAEALATCEALDVEMGRWTEIAHLPGVRTMHAGARAPPIPACPPAITCRRNASLRGARQPRLQRGGCLPSVAARASSRREQRFHRWDRPSRA